jgi:hypothetical protein
MQCYGQEVNGRWETNGCLCEECCQYEDSWIESEVEMGRITDNQARSMHLANDVARGYPEGDHDAH